MDLGEFHFGPVGDWDVVVREDQQLNYWFDQVSDWQAEEVNN